MKVWGDRTVKEDINKRLSFYATMEWSSDRYWEILCSFVPFWYTLFVFNIIFLVLIIISLSILHDDQESGAFVVALISLVIVGVSQFAVGIMIRLCRNR